MSFFSSFATFNASDMFYQQMFIIQGLYSKVYSYGWILNTVIGISAKHIVTEAMKQYSIKF